MNDAKLSFGFKILIAVSILALHMGITNLEGEVVKMKIMTYNIRHGLGADDVYDFDRIIDVVQSENPDILILNEVDQGCIRTGFIHQAGMLAEKTSMDFVFGATESRTDYGNAVLSKYPITESRTFHLPQPKWMKALIRGCVKIKVDVNGLPVSVYGTHLGLGGFQEIQTELGAIFEETKKEDIPTVIAGDFNIEYGELRGCVKGFFDTFKSVNHSVGVDLHTFPADNPGPQIDYIIVNGYFKPCEIYTVNSVASDHLAVVCIAEVGLEQ